MSVFITIGLQCFALLWHVEMLDDTVLTTECLLWVGAAYTGWI